MARSFRREDVPVLDHDVPDRSVPDHGVPDFDAVLHEQLAGPDHRLAEINGELARIGTCDPGALALLLEASRCYLQKNDHLRQEYYAAQAFERAVAFDDRGAVAEAGMSLALSGCWTGGLYTARVHADRVAAHLDRADDTAVGRLLPLLTDLSWVESQLQRFPEAEAHQRRGMRVAEALQEWRHALLLRVLHGATLRELGRLGEAERHTLHALRTAETRGHPDLVETALIALSEIALEAGDNERARELAEQARTVTPFRGPFEDAALVLIGMTMLRTGSLRDGRDTVLEAVGGKRLPLVPFVGRARVYAVLASADSSLDQHGEAREWSRLAMSSALACGMNRAHGYAQLAHAEAVLGSDPDGAQRAADAACVAFERGRARLGLAAAYLMAGAAHGRKGRRRASQSALARSEELYRASAAPVAADNVRLLRAAGRSAPAGDAGPGPIECLSPRELQVARLIARGSSNQQIASALDIKLNTVQVHVGRILRKLRVGSRVAVARVVMLAESTAASDRAAVPAGGGN
ncbi:LuxR C-terminal-related transcriptional regulator [Streptomyces sp. NPDC007025]|uniref:LuxR C-terminal-related transcriptional regulator n=1 Tax=Streptomyces sp. NPDC007025 TaxID=3364771 RepID=UPI0036A8F089